MPAGRLIKGDVTELKTIYQFSRRSFLRAILQYVDYRFADPAYPDASPGKFQVKEWLKPGCGRLFVRTPEALLYCTDDCAREDR